MPGGKPGGFAPRERAACAYCLPDHSLFFCAPETHKSQKDKTILTKKLKTKFGTRKNLLFDLHIIIIGLS
jgi:hypothetical protein